VKLISTREAILDEDLDVDPSAETAVNWVYKGLAWYANWRSEWNGVPNKKINVVLRDMHKPQPVEGFFDPVRLTGDRESPFSGGTFDLSDIKLKEAVRH